jgi:type IV secretion system protein VirB9
MHKVLSVALLTTACTVQHPPTVPAPPPPAPVVEAKSEDCAPPPPPPASEPQPAVSAHEQQALARYRKTGKATPITGRGFILYPFGRSEPTVSCQRLTVCTIVLQRGEEVTDAPSCGDCGNDGQWVIDGKRAGKGDTQVQVITVKPKEFASNTNLVIYTDRRIYYLRLVVKAKQRATQVSFYYPEEEAE